MEKNGYSSKNSSKEMEVGDGGSMAQSDEESDSENDNTGVGRTYECNYCKRGFTNAQALGGHMNIHRKDKAKAKQQQQQQQQPSFSSSSSISFKPASMEPISAYSSSFVPQRSYQGYYPCANNNPSRFLSQPSSFYEGNIRDFTNRRTRLFGLYDDHLGPDLSLRISSSNIDPYQGGKEKNKKKEEDYNAIDLELRLGYDP